MTSPVRILGIGGSVRAESMNKRLLELMLESAREMGASPEIADVHALNLPIFNQYIPSEDQPEKLTWLIDEVKRADGFIICSPTYLGSISGAVKNVLDSLHLAHGEPRVYFEGRPVALATFGFHGQMNTVNSMAFIARVMGATVVPEKTIVSGDDTTVDEDIFQSELVQQQITRTVRQLIEFAQEIRGDTGLG